MKSYQLVLTVALLIYPATAQPETKPAARPRQRSFISHLVIESLSLNAEQQTALRQLETEFQREQSDWMATRETQRAALRKRITTARAAGDEAQVKELYRQWRELFRPLSELRTQYRNRLRESLTEGQQKQFDELLSHPRHKKHSKSSE